MPLEAYDSFSHSGTISPERDSIRSPSSIINNNSIFEPNPEEEADEEDEEDEEEDNSLIQSMANDMLEEIDRETLDDLRVLAGQRNIPLEDVQYILNRPKVKVLTFEEKDRILRCEKFNKMSEVERDIEARFGML